jgi:hypothetical protein
VALTFLVIAHHAGQAYGAAGAFWLYENPKQWPKVTIPDGGKGDLGQF